MSGIAYGRNLAFQAGAAQGRGNAFRNLGLWQGRDYRSGGIDPREEAARAGQAIRQDIDADADAAARAAADEGQFQRNVILEQLRQRGRAGLQEDRQAAAMDLAGMRHPNAVPLDDPDKMAKWLEAKRALAEITGQTFDQRKALAEFKGEIGSRQIGERTAGQVEVEGVRQGGRVDLAGINNGARATEGALNRTAAGERQGAAIGAAAARNAETQKAAADRVRMQIDARLSELQLKLADRGLDRASREVLTREGNALRQRLAEMGDATRRSEGAANRGAAQQRTEMTQTGAMDRQRMALEQRMFDLEQRMADSSLNRASRETLAREANFVRERLAEMTDTRIRDEGEANRQVRLTEGSLNRNARHVEGEAGRQVRLTEGSLNRNARFMEGEANREIRGEEGDANRQVRMTEGSLNRNARFSAQTRTLEDKADHRTWLEKMLGKRLGAQAEQNDKNREVRREAIRVGDENRDADRALRETQGATQAAQGQQRIDDARARGEAQNKNAEARLALAQQNAKAAAEERAAALTRQGQRADASRWEKAYRQAAIDLDRAGEWFDADDPTEYNALLDGHAAEVYRALEKGPPAPGAEPTPAPKNSAAYEIWSRTTPPGILYRAFAGDPGSGGPGGQAAMGGKGGPGPIGPFPARTEEREPAAAAPWFDGQGGPAAGRDAAFITDEGSGRTVTANNARTGHEVARERLAARHPAARAQALQEMLQSWDRFAAMGVDVQALIEEFGE